MEDRARATDDHEDVRLLRTYLTFNKMEDPAHFMTYSKDAFRKHRHQMLRELVQDGEESKMLRTAPALALSTRTVMPKGFPSVSGKSMLNNGS